MPVSAKFPEERVRHLLAAGECRVVLTQAAVHEAYGEALEKYGGLVRGKDFWSKRLAEDHAIFHAFFDIEGGMPNNSGTAQGKSRVLTWNHMTGHFIKGRMVGLTSNGWSWGSPAGVRLAVNVVIYALTQEGSLTQRLMQTVN